MSDCAITNINLRLTQENIRKVTTVRQLSPLQFLRCAVPPSCISRCCCCTSTKQPPPHLDRHRCSSSTVQFCRAVPPSCNSRCRCLHQTLRKIRGFKNGVHQNGIKRGIKRETNLSTINLHWCSSKSVLVSRSRDAVEKKIRDLSFNFYF